MYSQNDEERVILDFFKGHAPGRFLEIGAFDGRTFSNVLALTDRGWGGTLVEASSEAFLPLKQEYAKRGPNYKLVQALLGTEWCLKKFWDSPDLVATDDPAHLKKWEKAASFQEVMMPELPLSVLLEACPGPYHFINIDVEGVATYKLFCAMPFRALGCELVCVEVNHEPEPFRKVALASGLVEIHKTSENIIFKVD